MNEVKKWHPFDWRKPSRPHTLVLITGIAIAVLVHLWHYYNAEPWTRDGGSWRRDQGLRCIRL